MNGKSIQIDQNANSHFNAIALQPASTIGKIYRTLSGLLFRSELEKAQARYQARHQRKGLQHNPLKDLPLEEKLRFGMYRWMD